MDGLRKCKDFFGVLKINESLKTSLALFIYLKRRRIGGDGW